MKPRGKKSKGLNRIRLGRDREEALSLEALGDLPQAESETPPEVHVDWDRAARLARLTPLEQRVFDAVWRRGLPVTQVKAGAAKAGNVRRAVANVSAKLESAGLRLLPAVAIRGGSSTCLSFQEHYPSGARPWALAVLDEAFAAVMAKELYSLCSQRDTARIGKLISVCPLKVGAEKMITQISMADRLMSARRKLSDLRDAEQYHQSEVKDLRGLASTAVAAAREEDENALIESREADPRPAKVAAETAGALAKAEARLAIASGALLRQQNAINEIQGEIAARHRADCHAAAKPHWDAWLTAQREAAEHLRQFMTAAGGECFAISELSPNEIPSVRDELQRLSAASGAFLRVLAMFDPELRRRLGWETAA